MDKAVDWKTFEFKRNLANVGPKGLTIISHGGICHIEATIDEFKAFGELLIA